MSEGTINRLKELIGNGEILESLAVTVVDGKKYLVYLNAETNDFWAVDINNPNVIKDMYIQAKRNNAT